MPGTRQQVIYWYTQTVIDQYACSNLAGLLYREECRFWLVSPFDDGYRPKLYRCLGYASFVTRVDNLGDILQVQREVRGQRLTHGLLMVQGLSRAH